jgi:acetoacetyl-[acyl-carrier protein] synthase
MGQLDFNGSAGMLQSALLGKRVSAKNCPLGLAEMTADFVNAYILGSVGATGANVGACATFLYNLRQGISDIRSGQCRVAVIGSSEAPITPEVIEGYRTMGALAEDDPLCKLDGITDGQPDHQRACRPFADNCGFTLAEASQFVILFDDALAVELGAHKSMAQSPMSTSTPMVSRNPSLVPGLAIILLLAKPWALFEPFLEMMRSDITPICRHMAPALPKIG